MNITCTICSELLVTSENIFTTPCGHIFHQSCLTQWISNSKTCPQCRTESSETTIHRIFFNQIGILSQNEIELSLQEKLQTLQEKFNDQERARKIAEDQKLKLAMELDALRKSKPQNMSFVTRGNVRANIYPNRRPPLPRSPSANLRITAERSTEPALNRPISRNHRKKITRAKAYFIAKRTQAANHN